MKQGIGIVMRHRSAVVGQHVEEPILIGVCCCGERERNNQRGSDRKSA
jgi:hypothetical protein